MVVRLLISLFFSAQIWACNPPENESETPQIYSGPLSKLSDAVIVFSDSALKKGEVFAREILDLQNGDREVPFGMNINFFDKKGAISATLRANYAYYYKEKDSWKATGDVVINNIENKETLKTEELFWEPKTENVYTEKFVRIETPGELMTGTGLKAKQDFSEWSLEKPEGIIDFDDEDGA